MKEKVENVPPEFTNSLRPNPSYASSASSTSSYASTLSSSSSAASSYSGFGCEKSSSFLHSNEARHLTESSLPPPYPHHPAHQYRALSRCPSGSSSPPNPQSFSPSSSPASSSAEYATVPFKFNTLSRAMPNGRPTPVLRSANPITANNPNFRHSVISTAAAPPKLGEHVSMRLGSSYSIARVGHDVGSSNALNGDGGMRGVSSLGEVTSSTHRSPHYASTPHLFVFQAPDDEEDLENNDDSISQVTKCNTLRNTSTAELVETPTNISRTLPRPPTSQQMKEPIYSSTVDIRKDISRREEAAAGHITDHYESPRCLSATRRSSSCSMIDQDSFAVTKQVVSRIETSFRGHKTQVWVCRTMANLYTEEGSGNDSKWVLKNTGVPVLLLDLGETKSRTKRQLQIILAEKESGFELWKDVIDNLTSYKVQEPHFHTMFLSSDHRRKIGLSYNEGDAAMTFHKQLESLTSNPENISLNAPGKKKKPKNKEKPLKYKPPRKNDISKPCNFHHVTSVDPEDRCRLYTLQICSKNPPQISSNILSQESSRSLSLPVHQQPAPTAV
ncbi:WH1/EVH1 domain [Trinorchestia longiramus]|nr:WH1/EVH1 domain [Trinorchestia longiramus]